MMIIVDWVSYSVAFDQQGRLWLPIGVPQRP